MALIIQMICASRMRFLMQIRRYRNTTDYIRLDSSDFSMCFFIEFLSCSFEDISLDKVIPSIAFYHINIPGWFLTYFRLRIMALIIPMICASRMRFITQIRRYRSTID